MASISTSRDGHRTILFVGADNKRQRVRLGRVPKKTADEVKLRIERLNAARKAGTSVDDETADWVNRIGDKLFSRLVKVGLVEPRQPAATADGPAPVPLGDFLEDFIAKRATMKANSRSNLVSAKKRLVKCYGPDRDMRTIISGDADDFVLFLRREGYAEATVGRTVKQAKQFFRAAARARLILESPFSDVKAPKQQNDARWFFVKQEVAEKVFNACPNAEWRLLFALSRYGGLRCPSEHFGLLWSEVDWERSRFLVHSPKTEHHPNGGKRWVPIFPELRPYLEEAWDLAEEGAVYVVGRYRDTNKNLRTQLQRIIKRAGLEPWPKLFHNLRASRQTELEERFPSHVVCTWLGNSEKVAAAHYTKVREEDFERAAQGHGDGFQKAAQKVAQYGAAPARTGSKEQTADPEKPLFFQRVRVGAETCETAEYARRDSNPLVFSEESVGQKRGGAKSGADLAKIVAKSNLPADAKREILAMLASGRKDNAE